MVNRGIPKQDNPSPVRDGGHGPHIGITEGGGKSEQKTPS